MPCLEWVFGNFRSQRIQYSFHGENLGLGFDFEFFLFKEDTFFTLLFEHRVSWEQKNASLS